MAILVQSSLGCWALQMDTPFYVFNFTPVCHFMSGKCAQYTYPTTQASLSSKMAVAWREQSLFKFITDSLLLHVIPIIHIEKKKKREIIANRTHKLKLEISIALWSRIDWDEDVTVCILPLICMSLRFLSEDHFPEMTRYICSDQDGKMDVYCILCTS